LQRLPLGKKANKSETFSFGSQSSRGDSLGGFTRRFQRCAKISTGVAIAEEVGAGVPEHRDMIFCEMFSHISDPNLMTGL